MLGRSNPLRNLKVWQDGSCSVGHSYSLVLPAWAVKEWSSGSDQRSEMEQSPERNGLQLSQAADGMLSYLCICTIKKTN